MASLTISVGDDVLKRARIRALELDTSVNAYLAGKLEEFVADTDPHAQQREAVRRVLGNAASFHGESGPGGRTWSRESVYEERLARFDR